MNMANMMKFKKLCERSETLRDGPYECNDTHRSTYMTLTQTDTHTYTYSYAHMKINRRANINTNKHISQHIHTSTHPEKDYTDT